MKLAPENLGPTISIGEILADVLVTKFAVGFEEPVPMIGPFPSSAPATFIVQCSLIGGAAALFIAATEPRS